MQPNEDIYQIAGEMRAIAGEGLLFSDNGYHKERYEHLMNLAARLLSVVETEAPDRIQAHLLDNLWHLCPLIGVETAVFREDRLLLVQLREDGLWVLPGGLCEVGEKLAAAGIRELWEEAGVHAEIKQLLAVCDSRLWAERAQVRMQVPQAKGAMDVLRVERAQDNLGHPGP